MGMTVYLFDKWKKVRRIIPPGGVTELIHDEGAYTLTAQVASELNVRNREYLGFRCVDGHFRLFEVTGANLDDDRHVIDITATDAIVQELSESITEDLQQLDVDLTTAIKGILPEDEWTVKGNSPDRKENSRAYYTPAWTMLQTFEQLYEWRIIPYYGFDGGKIIEKVIELKEDKAVFRGRILRSRKDAAKVYVTKTGRHITRLYGLGPAQGSQDLQTNLTFADVEWSVANGDPADKPKGQAWIEDPVAAAMDGVHTAVVSITDAEDAVDLLKKTWEQLQIMQMPTVKADATISDMEMVPGHSHEQIRIGDLIAIWLDAGYAVEARIIGIKRNYIRRWLTKITIGDKTATLQSQVSDLIASATHTFERLTVYQNRFKEDEELIQLNAAVIQLNAEHIQENANSIIEHAQWILNQAELIELKASQEDLDKVVVRLDSAEGTLTAQADEIILKADKTYVDNLYAQTVKASELETEILTVVDSAYILGELTGKDIGAQSLSCESIAGGSGSFDELYVDQLDGEWCSWQNVTMGSIFSGTMLVANGNTDLSHSHAVSVGSDGTITLGEVATTGGTFSVATQSWVQEQGYVTASTSSLTNYYTKNEVYSADETFNMFETYLGSYGYATQDWVTENFSNARTTYSPASIERYGTLSGTTIPVRTLNAGGTELLTGTVDAGDVYTAGNTAGYNSGYADASPASVSRVSAYDSTANAYNVTVVVKSADGTHKNFGLVAISADAAFNTGYADAVNSATFSVDGTNVVVTFGDGSTKSFNVDSYVSATATTEYVSSTDTTMTVRAKANVYFNGTYCGTWTGQGTYDTV